MSDDESSLPVSSSNRINDVDDDDASHRSDSLSMNEREILHEDLPYPSIRIPIQVWESRIQDTGGSKEMLPAKTYLGKQIPPYGPNKIYYYDLACIAIDYIGSMKEGKDVWSRMPRNVSDVKKRIIKVILTMRKYGDNGYELCQTNFIGILHNQWGGARAIPNITDNDKLRVFGLLLSVEENDYILRRLSEGMKIRAHMDDVLYSPKEMFSQLSLDYNNDEKTIELPSAAEDLESYAALDANETVRIRILRDWNWIKAVYTATMSEYKEILNEWNKGTGGGPGLLDKFESWGTEKCNKHDIDPSIYDHTDISNRPAILMDGYAKRKPYLTCIFMWDEKKNFILSSKYQPLDIGNGETGFTSSLTEDTISATSNITTVSRSTSNNTSCSKRMSPTKKPIDPKDNLADMVSSVIGTIMKNDKKVTLEDKVYARKKNKKRKKVLKATSINDEPLPNLMALVDKHQNYMKFLKDCGMLTPERTQTIVGEIDDIFQIIKGREEVRNIGNDVGQTGDGDCDSNSVDNSSSSSSSRISRNRNGNIAKHHKIKKNNEDLLEMNVLNELVNGNLHSSHSLVELSAAQWKRYKHNCIIVSDLMKDNTSERNMHIKYQNIVVGNNLKLKKKSCISFGKVLRWKEVLLKNTNCGYMMIVVKKDELMVSNPNITVIDGSSQEGIDNGVMLKNSSGLLILFLGRIQRQTKVSKYVWGRKESIMLKGCKPNIIKGNGSHFGSTGKYYSFGARANYGKIDKSSLTQYVSKKFKSEERSVISSIDAQYMENRTGRELSQSIKYLSKIIPNLRLYICPTISVVHELQEEIGECNINKIEGSDSGLWMTAVCVSSQTEILHTEDDFTYTVISVPEQEQAEDEPVFIFELMDKYTLGVQMETGLSFIFSGKYLTHRQVIPDCNSKDGNFINIASYGSKRLYNHIKSTVSRVIE